MSEYLGNQSGRWYECYGVVVDCTKDESLYAAILPLNTRTIRSFDFTNESIREGSEDGLPELNATGIWDTIPDIVKVSGWTIVPDEHGTHFVFACSGTRQCEINTLREWSIGRDDFVTGWIEDNQGIMRCRGFLAEVDLREVNPSIISAARDAMLMRQRSNRPDDK